MIYYHFSIDDQILKFISEKFQKDFELTLLKKASSSPKYKKYLGHCEWNGIIFKIYTNNLEALLNRQIIFEMDLNNTDPQSFIIERNPYFNQNTKDLEDQFNLYSVNFSSLGTLGTSLEILNQYFEGQKKNSLIELLHSKNIFKDLASLPIYVNKFGLKSLNLNWKFYYEKNLVGFVIDWPWMKKSKLEDWQGLIEASIKFKNQTN